MPNSFKKFGEVAVSDLINYLRLSGVSTADEELLTTILEAGKNYILGYTGVELLQANTYPEFTIALYVLCEDMFDKRTYSIDKSNSNKVVDNILGMRSINLL